MSSLTRVIKYGAIALAIIIILTILNIVYHFGFIVGDVFFDNDDEIVDILNYYENKKILKIDLSTSVLNIKHGDKFKVETSNTKIKVEEQKDQIRIYQKGIKLFNISKKYKVNVTIPEDFTLDNVDISNKAGTIDIEGLKTDNLKLDIGAGKVFVKSLIVNKNALIETGAGETTIRNSEINNLNLDIGVGQVNLDAILNGKTKIDAGVGELNLNLLDGKDNYKIEVDSGIGSIKIDGNKVSDGTIIGDGINKIDVDGGVGSINIKFKE